MPKPASDTVDVDRLASDFDSNTLEEAFEWFEGPYSAVLDEALREGLSEEEAEERAQKAEDEERFEAERKYIDAIISVADDLYGKHGLTLVPKLPKRLRNKRDVRAFEYKVVPTTTWMDAAREIVKTINGVGTFEFSSTKEFLESGPWTARQAVLQHLHWIADWPDVYEGRKASSMVDRALR